ncbi:uncharacterized protein K460DRAFT_421172 [Cucurbitaria berberidis CBS 394.84]|uniref:Uncharacterized protein n=1 Tax=Cucurbitaria berberidis CBS 394.84 TaxID=1168544 RepID=A0A9P4G710_9PLEO|nr:uncharacterized protein K460DRAFT_421172 [Cucurbitaria berberidis CBS 394.84]KAF1840179.1 hypothetical protein K460DRAFT_421172 [Cucurbitaria berberidis CBS 394.84]
MAPSHSTPSSEAARIPLRRFATHFLLSTLATAIPQLLQYFADAHIKKVIVSLSWGATHACGFLIYVLLSSFYPNDMAFVPDIIYGIAGSSLISTLHIITILLGRYVEDSDSGFTTRQHIAVHFCLVVYVITELEFYRAYTGFKKFDTYTECLKSLPLANVNHSFLYCRDPFGYMIDMPNSWRRYLNGDNDLRTFWDIAFSKSHNILCASYLLFHVVCGLANYSIKRMVNPDPEYALRSAMVNGLILFGTYPASIWEVLLGLALLRVVRQANYVGFWVVVGLVEWWGRQLCEVLLPFWVDIVCQLQSNSDQQSPSWR